MAFDKGADPEQLDASAGRLRDIAKELHGVETSATGVLTVLTANWQGSDLATTSAAFKNGAAPSIRQAAQTIEGLAKLLTSNAAAQRTASGEGGSGSGGGTGGSGGSGSGSGSGDGSGSGGSGGDSGGDDDAPGSTKAGASYTVSGHKTEAESKHGNTTSTASITELGPGSKVEVGTETEDGNHKHGQTYSETYVGEHKVASETHKTYGYERGGDPEPRHAAPDDPNSLKNHVDGSATIKGPSYSTEGGLLMSSGGNDNASYTAGLGVYKVDASTEAGYKDGMLMAGASATAGAYAGYATGKVSAGPAYAQGTAYVGAEASADGGVGIGKDGLTAQGSVDAFVGGKAEAEGGIDTEYVDASVGGSVSYGLGVHADASASLSMDKVGVSADLGATLGLGFEVKFDVSINPKEVLGDVGHALNPTNWF